MSHSIEYKIILRSPMATSTGSNDFLVDADVLTDSYGIPYINERRLKGLLKEYVKEVLEICGRADDSKTILNYLFGEMGNHQLSASIEAEDAIIENYKDCLATIDKNKIPKSFVKKYFTKIIQQTAIDKKNHTAKKHSLRKIRAVKENVVFTSKIKVANDWSKDLISLALLQWNLMGTQRNEGLGSVKIEINSEIKIDVLVDSVTNLNISELTNNLNDIGVNTLAKKTYSEKTGLKIELKNKLILSRVQGDENIVNSRSLIEGRVLWGFFAGEYLKYKGPDETFHKIFNEGKVRFSSAYPLPLKMEEAFEPMPYHVQFVKNSQDLKPVNLFTETTEEKTKTQSSFHSKGRLYKVPQTISFHLNRENNRLSGTSTDGEIFYYEAIDCGQCFVTKIEGDKTLINDLLNTVFRGRDTLNGKIGRSKSVEYGKVDIKTMELPSEVQPENNKNNLSSFTFYFTSPCVVTNEHDFAIPNMANLKAALEQAGIKGNIIKAVCRHEERQYFSGVWKSKSSLHHCFETGSAFKVELQEPMPEAEITRILGNGIGLDTHHGMGSGQIYHTKNETFQEIKVSQSECDRNIDKNPAKHPINTSWNQHNEFSNVRLQAIKRTVDLKYEPNSITNSQLSFISSALNKYRTYAELKKYIDDELINRPIGPIILNDIRVEYIFNNIVNKNQIHFYIYLNQYLKMCRLINNQKNDKNAIKR